MTFEQRGMVRQYWETEGLEDGMYLYVTYKGLTVSQLDRRPYIDETLFLIPERITSNEQLDRVSRKYLTAGNSVYETYDGCLVRLIPNKGLLVTVTAQGYSSTTFVEAGLVRDVDSGGSLIGYRIDNYFPVGEVIEVKISLPEDFTV